jgi:transcriptional regulator with XRE-family HTH domain
MMPRTSKATTEHDRYIGERIREARIAAAMSQTQLGHLIGVSYQQIQKYEHGSNRVASARLGLLVSALNRPLSFFYANATDVRAASDLSRVLATKDGHALVGAFSLITSAKNRRLVIDLAHSLAAKEQGR